jgi:rhodanese-related sulfurtransferase
MLIDKGFSKAVELLGGIDEWERQFGKAFLASFKLTPPER